MKKAIVLYKNRKYKYVNESQVVSLIEKRRKDLFLIMVPYLDTDGEVYIPVKPNPNLVFHHVELQMITTIFTIDQDTDSITPNSNIGETQEYRSLFEFINALFYYHKLGGYSHYIEACSDEACPYITNIMGITGLRIYYYSDKKGKLFRKVNIVNDTDIHPSDIYYDEAINCILYSYKEIDDIIFPIDNLSSREKDLFRIALNDIWEPDRKIRNHQTYLYGIYRFNCYCILDRELADILGQLDKLTLSFITIVDDPQDINKRRPRYGTPEYSQWIKNEYNIGCRNVDYYHMYWVGISIRDDYLELIYFLKTILMYTIYVLYYGILEMDGYVENYHAFAMIKNEVSCESKVIMDYDKFSVNTIYKKLLKLGQSKGGN